MVKKINTPLTKIDLKGKTVDLKKTKLDSKKLIDVPLAERLDIVPTTYGVAEAKKTLGLGQYSKLNKDIDYDQMVRDYRSDNNLPALSEDSKILPSRSLDGRSDFLVESRKVNTLPINNAFVVKQGDKYTTAVFNKNNRLIENPNRADRILDRRVTNFTKEQYGKDKSKTDKHIRDGIRDLGANPYYEYGGHLMLPEYGFGSWLKENGAGLLKGAGSLVNLIPGVGQIAGPLLNVAGSAVGGIQQKNTMKDAASLEQGKLDAEAALVKKQQASADLAVRNTNLFGDRENINYGATFEYGGDLMMGQESNVPNITKYSKKADLHSEGIGGIPVDARGNPTKVSKTSAVGMTEGGEVTWNGYVFSNKLKVKK